jgi:hypothetical protein
MDKNPFQTIDEDAVGLLITSSAKSCTEREGGGGQGGEYLWLQSVSCSPALGWRRRRRRYGKIFCESTNYTVILIENRNLKSKFFLSASC